MPNENKIFEAPPPPLISPDMELAGYKKPQSPLSQTSIQSGKRGGSGKRGSNAIILAIDDEGNYNPDLPQGIEIGKFRRQSASSDKYETRLEIDGNEIEIIDSSNYSKSSMTSSPAARAEVGGDGKKKHINASTNRWVKQKIF